MRKFLVILLALGLVMAFSMPAAATDLKVSGSYYVVGNYESNHTMQDGTDVTSDFYAQRLRLNAVFQVAEGLKLVTRADIMERVWSGNRVGYHAGYPDAKLGTNAGSLDTDEERNISWERIYAQFAALHGQFFVGYQQCLTWGTVFQDAASSAPRIKYVGSFGPWIVVALTEKGVEGDIGTDTVDSDYDKYAVALIYKWQGGQVGLLNFYLPARHVTNAEVWNNYLSPYFKATFGPLYLEGEASLWYGEADYDNPATQDVDREGWSFYLHGKYNLGPAYVGGQFAYVSGDDPNTAGDDEGGYPLNEDWDPCLILWNDNLHKWMGNLGSVTSGGTSDNMTNAFLYQIFAGFSPMEKLALHASLTYAQADEKPLNYVDDEYGTEFDITATYKIYDNLSYMVGVGYLSVGDYFKGTDASNQVDDNYLVMNKLTLKF